MSTETDPLIQPLGDSAANVSWPGLSEIQAANYVYALTTRLQSGIIHEHSSSGNPGRGYVAIVPAFVTVTVHYCPQTLTFRELHADLATHCLAMTAAEPPKSQLVSIPVCYDPEFALDLEEIAAQHRLTVPDVIQLHCSAEYTVRMIGFSPGFPYLSGLPEPLRTPRRSSPRQRVPAGSVAIGGRQAGVYSLETPGGWNIVGRTPVTLFQPSQSPPSLLNAGDRVRFFPVSRSEFDTLLRDSSPDDRQMQSFPRTPP